MATPRRRRKDHRTLDDAADVASVLLVESAQDDRAMYAEYLRLRGFQPIEIDNTGDALALAGTADVIVTGVRVPGAFDGIELVRRLRDGDGTRSKPVVVLTACVFEPNQQRAWAAGCDAFLAKPCLPDSLVTEIRRVMALRPGSLSSAVRAGGTRSRNKRRIA